MDRRKRAIDAYRRAGRPAGSSSPAEPVSAADRDADGAGEAESPSPGGFVKTGVSGAGVRRILEGEGTDRAARLLIALGPEQAGRILTGLPRAAVERLVGRIIRIPSVRPDEALAVLGRAGAASSDPAGAGPPAPGGPEVARSMLVAAFGQSAADRIFYRSVPNAPAQLLQFLNEYRPEQLLSVLRDESPAAVAVVLAHVDRRLAAGVLAGLDEERRFDVARRIARMGRLGREVVVKVGEALREKVRMVGSPAPAEPAGDRVETLATILRHMEPSTGAAILRDLTSDDERLGTAIRNRLNTIDALMLLSPRDLADLVREFDDLEVALLLQGKSEELRGRVLRAVSSRRREAISSAFAHGHRPSREEVDAVTSEVLERLRELAEAGAILVPVEGERYI